MNKQSEFLKDLAALSRKHGITITGCGCCGSPALEDLTDLERHPAGGYVYTDYLQWACPSSFGWNHEGYMHKDKVGK